MCGLIFHKDPSTGLHTLMALVSPLKIQRKYHMPWIGFMNGMSHYQGRGEGLEGLVKFLRGAFFEYFLNIT